jgi:dipeptidyl aminopeptidase/acylaminoacyl peptidase
MPRPIDHSDSAPWKNRFRAWRVSSASVAKREPSRGIAITNRPGRLQVHAWDVASGELRQLTTHANGIAAATLSPDGGFVYFHDDQMGNELGHVVRIPWEGGDKVDITPDMPAYAFGGIELSRDGSRIALLTATRAGFIAHAATLDADANIGPWTEVFRSGVLSSLHSLSADGTKLVASTVERSGTTDPGFVLVDVASGERVAELYDSDGGMQGGIFSPIDGDPRVAGASNASGFMKPFIWDTVTGERQDLNTGEIEGGAYVLGWSPDARNLLLLHTYRATTAVWRYDIEADQAVRLDCPAGTAGASFIDDATILAIATSSAHPPRVIECDAKTGSERRVLLAGEESEPSAAWRSVEFPSTNDATIQAWLALPKGASGPLPTILDVHGGPTAAQIDMFDPMKQAFVDHGFALLSVNYRGSTTFGHAFQHVIDRDLGHWEVDDLAAACDWLVAEGIADPARILITGWSYGGYLTLMGLGKLPERFAGGMAGVAVADWALMYEDEAETLRQFQTALLGGTPAEIPEQMAKSSPISYCQDVKAPLLVLQGANDTRCPRRQFEAYEEKMREYGKEITVHWFDAGHGARAIDQNIEHVGLMLDFATAALARVP